MRGILAPLSPHEEITLRRVALGFGAPDRLPEPFAPDRNWLVGHHLRGLPQSVFRLGLDGDAKIRGIREIGRQLANHH